MAKNGTGFFTQRKSALSVTVDTLSADSKAIAAHKTPAEIISGMVQRGIADVIMTAH
jgi:hypothetical protein